MEDLIPGLPEEIGLQCLIRVPHGTLPLLRQVCHRWKKAIESPFFHHLRRSTGSSHNLLIFIEARHIVKRSPRLVSSYNYRGLTTLNLSTSEWAPLPPIPLVSLANIYIASGLYLVAIYDYDQDSLNCNDGIHIYSFLSNTWRRGRSMPGPTRFLFACAGSPNNQIFIAGGHDEQKKALKSAMVYDIAKDDWTMLPEMEREREDCRGVFEAELFKVIGGSMQKRLEWSKEAFDVRERRWRAIEEAAVPEEEFPETYVMGGHGRNYKRGVGGKMLLAKEGEEWREVAELPEDVRGSSIMVIWAERLIVVRVESCGWTSTMFVMGMKEGVATGWQKVAFPKKHHGYVCTACVDI